MDEFVSLLRTLKKDDKITQNVLFMISESLRHDEGIIGETLIRQYRDSFNKEPVLDFLFILCSKDTKYLSFFKAHKEELGVVDHKLAELLESKDGDECSGEQEAKRVKLSDDYGGHAGGADVPRTEQRGSKGSGRGRDSRVPGSGAVKSRVFEEALSKNYEKKDAVDACVLDNKYLRSPASPSVLYAPHQCKLCGLRFEDTAEGNEAMGVHIEEHRRKARVLGERDCISREFFQTLDAWTKNIEKVKLNLKVEKVEKIVHSGGPASCDVCHDRIEVEWDDEEDNWILKDGVSLEKGGETSFCHRRCVS